MYYPCACAIATLLDHHLKATYGLEILEVGSICKLHSVISAEHYNSMTGIAMQFARSDPVHEPKLAMYAKACVQPAYNGFMAKF